MFTLIWLDVTLDELADVYVAVTPEQRARIAAGIEALNTRLRDDPLSVGESRSGGRRLVFTPLLAVTFQVSVSDRTVRVTSVKQYGK